MTDGAMTDPNDKTPKGVNEVERMDGYKLNPLTRVHRDCSGVFEFGGERENLMLRLCRENSQSILISCQGVAY
jgi:hypothetical protein